MLQMWNKNLLKKALVVLVSVSGLVFLSVPSPEQAPSPASTKQSLPQTLKKFELKQPDFSSLKNWGIFSARDSHIRAVDAWKIQKGNKKVVVAVVDTGIDASHPLLKENLWKSPKDPSVYGWNFVTNKPNPDDDHGHGTHVSGIIGAQTDLKSGVSGVVQHVSIMAVKYYSEANSGAVNLANTVKALNYAIDNGAQIINYSGGGPEFSEEEYLAMKKAEAKGVLIVAAAGNERKNSDLIENYYYPAAYGLSNIISVAAIDPDNVLLRSSNWGVKKVDVAAPGENIYSTLPDGKFGYMSGTSQATAFVSGMAALLLSQDDTLTPSQIKSIIRESVDLVSTLKGKVGTSGRVNAHRALLAVAKPSESKPSTIPAQLVAEVKNTKSVNDSAPKEGASYGTSPAITPAKLQLNSQ